MRAPWSIAIAVFLGISGGLILGLFLRTGNSLTLLLAVAVFGATVTAPVAAWNVEERREQRQADAERRTLNRRRYDQHAAQFNRDVYSLLRHAEFHPNGTPPPDRAVPAGVSLAVGDRPVDIPTLPNWELALDHLTSDPEMAASWTTVVRATHAAAAARAAAADLLVERLSTRVLDQYGLATKLEGSRLQAPPWCDLSTLASIALDPVDPGTGSLTRIGGGPDVATSPCYVLRGEVPLLAVTEWTEADPTRLERMLSEVQAEPEIVRRSRLLTARERAALDAVGRFAELARRYSDRVTLEGSFRGACAACDAWSPR